MRRFMKLGKKRHKKKHGQRDQMHSYIVGVGSESTDNTSEASTDKNEVESYEGRLSKYTNLMKGWQYRWFILDLSNGVLKYFLSEKQRSEAPRGWIYLGGATVSPSDEDESTFTIQTTLAELYKLRADDTKSRQEWVNKLRQIAENYASNSSPLMSIDQLAADSLRAAKALAIAEGVTTDSSILLDENITTGEDLSDSLSVARDHTKQAMLMRNSMEKAIEALPNTGEMTHNDSSLLVLKASTQSMMSALDCCVNMLDQITSNSSHISGPSRRRKKS